MKLSLSALFLVAAFVNVQAASSDKSSNSNIICTRPNNRGSGSGLGWRGFCCKTDDDCHESCIKGKCNGRVDPKYASPINDGTCIDTGNIGSRTGEGWGNFCCETSEDCREDCVKGKCTGKTHCILPKNQGKGSGQGWKDYCCKNSDDCRDSCIKGRCTGKPNPKFA
ncbi:uncharacterized protein RHIMIDRAFT_302745 [Rhizopus microsporus ATCC 52813]|uniref:Uncharacterized protein n=1 Tax=Rhizopus microsporus ATCC 52813 TaxID=1340429 RepID=A0A2G4T2X8_RHIZD|nr:uncharacterized protein RHIMIDRAFT_302745 [Rhizopus microsporus ATCC 52813]PHZ15354.1 hypothetical protein RHIMIDRAFT_302745 [Rhizopus microsporus ATCC 52813]